MVVTTALKEALNDAITSGKFIDTKIVLFSRRDSSGRVCKPKALYANSHVLKSVPYFNACEFLCRVPFVVFEMTLLLEYFLANIQNQRPRISPRPLTMKSSQRTTGTLLIVTLKRIGILRVPLPRAAGRNLKDKRLFMANTKNMSRWARLLGFKTWLSLRTFT